MNVATSFKHGNNRLPGRKNKYEKSLQRPLSMDTYPTTSVAITNNTFPTSLPTAPHPQPLPTTPVIRFPWVPSPGYWVPVNNIQPHVLNHQPLSPEDAFWRGKNLYDYE